MSVCSLLRGVERAFCSRSVSSGRADCSSQAQETVSLQEFSQSHQFQLLDQSESQAVGSSPWKFWRRFSTRSRSERNLKTEPRTRPEITLLEPHSEVEPSPECLADSQSHTGTLSGKLPDVVDKAPGTPSRPAGSNGVAPPKPPRLFLYRTPSNVSKHSKACSDITDPSYGNIEGSCNGRYLADQANVVTSQPKSNSSPIQSENNNIPKQLSRNGVEIPAGNTEECSTKEEDQLPKLSLSPISSSSNTSEGHKNNKNTSNTSVHQDKSPPVTTGLTVASRKPKIKSPDLSSRRHHGHAGRSRRRSHDRSGGSSGSSSSDPRSRQRHMMCSISELLRQTLDPYPLLEPLKRAGVLTNVDVQSFLGHHDRKSVCESLVDIVGDAGPQAINVFSDVLANQGTCSEILEVLQVMREMDRIVHEIAPAARPPSPSSLDGLEDDVAVPVEEKSLRYEIGYLTPDHSLKPLVELDRAQRLSKTASSARSSAYSLLETSGGDSASGIFPGLVMMSMCVTGHDLSGPRSVAMARLLSERRCVCELRVGKTRLTGEDVAVLAEALKDNATVHALDLRLNTIDLSGIQALTELLHNTRTLRELNLSSCGLSTESLKALTSAVGSNKSLFDLDLSFLDVTDESAACFRDMLRSNCGLRKLRLRSNNLTWSGCYVITEGLTRSSNLQVLDLSRNTLGDAGMQALAKFLPETSIAELYLENCGITASGCDSLGELIARCKRLRTLDVSTNILTDSGLAKLTAALERSSSIENVGLNMCGLTNDGFWKLLDVLEKSTSLLHVKLCYNRLGEAGYSNEQATPENLRYRHRIVTSSRPKLKILLWGNALEEEP